MEHELAAWQSAGGFSDRDNALRCGRRGRWRGVPPAVHCALLLQKQHSSGPHRLPACPLVSPCPRRRRLKATLQRLRRLTEAYSQTMLDAYAERAAVMGRALGLDADRYNGAGGGGARAEARRGWGLRPRPPCSLAALSSPPLLTAPAHYPCASPAPPLHPPTCSVHRGGDPGVPGVPALQALLPAHQGKGDCWARLLGLMAGWLGGRLGAAGGLASAQSSAASAGSAAAATAARC